MRNIIPDVNATSSRRSDVDTLALSFKVLEQIILTTPHRENCDVTIEKLKFLGNEITA